MKNEEPLESAMDGLTSTSGQHELANLAGRLFKRLTDCQDLSRGHLGELKCLRSAIIAANWNNN